MNESHVTVLIEFHAKPDEGERARRELSDLISTVVEKEPDCLGIRLHQDAEDEDRLMNVEQWTSQEAYTGPHMETPHLRAFIERSEAFLVGPPEITFWREVASATPDE